MNAFLSIDVMPSNLSPVKMLIFFVDSGRGSELTNSIETLLKSRQAQLVLHKLDY